MTMLTRLSSHIKSTTRLLQHGAKATVTSGIFHRKSGTSTIHFIPSPSSLFTRHKAVIGAVLFGAGAFAVAATFTSLSTPQKLEVEEIAMKLNSARRRWAEAYTNRYENSIGAERDCKEATNALSQLIHETAKQILYHDLFYQKTGSSQRFPISKAKNPKKWSAITQIITVMKDVNARCPLSDQKIVQYINNYAEDLETHTHTK